jgi:hypothetical protein
MTEMPSVRNGAQAGEKLRKNSLLNYESPALTAELQAHPRRRANIQHSTSNVQSLTGDEFSAEISDCGLWIADLGWSRDSRNPEHN